MAGRSVGAAADSYWCGCGGIGWGVAVEGDCSRRCGCGWGRTAGAGSRLGGGIVAAEGSAAAGSSGTVAAGMVRDTAVVGDTHRHWVGTAAAAVGDNRRQEGGTRSRLVRGSRQGEGLGT